MTKRLLTPSRLLREVKATTAGRMCTLTKVFLWPSSSSFPPGGLLGSLPSAPRALGVLRAAIHPGALHHFITS